MVYHLTLIDGVLYAVNEGKTLIGGTAYEIAKGKTLVGGTVYAVSLGPDVATIKLTGSGSYKHYIQVDGVQYDTPPKTIQVPIGTSIFLRSGTSYRLKIDGVVQSGYSMNYAVTQDITINFAYNYLSVTTT